MMKENKAFLFLRQTHHTSAQADKHLLFLFIFIKNISTSYVDNLLSWNFLVDKFLGDWIALPVLPRIVFNKSIESLGCIGLKKLKYKHNQATHIFIETF